MTILNIEQIFPRLQPNTTIAGLDLGSKTIGIAISDIGYRLSNPRPVIHRTKFRNDAQNLLDVFRAENVCAAIIGLPVNMDGTNGPRVQATRTFVRNMQPLTTTPFIFWDERLSTVAAQRFLIDLDVSRKKRAERIDSAAAAFILQGALDRFNTLKGSYPNG